MDPIFLVMPLMLVGFAVFFGVHFLVFRKRGYPPAATLMLAPAFIPALIALAFCIGWPVIVAGGGLTIQFVRGVIEFHRFKRTRNADGITSF